MTQLDLLSAASTERREKKRGHVPRTSVMAYREVGKDARVELVLAELGSYAIEYCHPPTSAELTQWHRYHATVTTDDLLRIRRGLSDACAAGLVEHVPHGERTCRVTGRRSITWRVRGR